MITNKQIFTHPLVAILVVILLGVALTFGLRKELKQKEYYYVFVYTTDNQVGRIFITAKDPINSEQRFVEVERAIANQVKKNIAIINFVKF